MRPGHGLHGGSGDQLEARAADQRRAQGGHLRSGRGAGRAKQRSLTCGRPRRGSLGRSLPRQVLTTVEVEARWATSRTTLPRRLPRRPPWTATWRRSRTTSTSRWRRHRRPQRGGGRQLRLPDTAMVTLEAGWVVVRDEWQCPECGWANWGVLKAEHIRKHHPDMAETLGRPERRCCMVLWGPAACGSAL